MREDFICKKCRGTSLSIQDTGDKLITSCYDCKADGPKLEREEFYNRKNRPQKKRKPPRSNCCDSRTYVAGDVTRHYVCSKCKEACDTKVDSRKSKIIKFLKRFIPCRHTFKKYDITMTDYPGWIELKICTKCKKKMEVQCVA